MSITMDLYIPPDEELTVQEVNVSGPVLKAAAFHVGAVCEAQNHEFMLCRQETRDARACINEGKAVTSCALNFFRKVKKSCAAEFNQYVHCLDKSSVNQDYTLCRKTQAVFDKCAKDNIGVDRLPYDHYSRAHVIKTSRPKPPIEEPAVYPDAVPKLPDDYPRPEAKYGTRLFGMW